MGVRTESVVIGTGSYTVVTSCTLSPRREPDGDESEREGHPLPGPARGAERISDSQPVGRRLGANPGRARLPGPGDLERRRGRRPRPARRHRVPRRGAGARARDRGRGRSSRLRRSREVLRRRAGRRRRHDPSRRQGRPGRRLDRGRDRRQGPAALRHRARHRARGRGRPGGALARLPLHADRAHGELPARQPEPRRHDQAPAGLREGGRRRADGAGPARPRLGARGVCRGEEAGQLHGRHQGQVVHGGRAPGRRREAHQRGLVILPRRDDRAARRGPRAEGQGHVRVPRPLDRDARSERVHVVKVTAVTPFVVDPGYGTNWLFVKVETSDGLHGWGECYTQADRDQSIVAHVRQLARYLVGRDAGQIRHFTHWAYHDFASKRGAMDFWSAVSGIEQALWDLAGKRLGVPVVALLGGVCRERIRVYANGWYSGAKTPEAYAAKAKETVARGFTALKFDPFPGPWRTHISRDAEREVEATVRAVREAVGPKIDLLIEVHRRLAPMHAVRIARMLEPFDPFWFEEPVSSRDLGALAECRSQIRMPIVTGEELYTRVEFREVFERRAADIINPDVCNVGGIEELKAIAAMAEAYHVVVSPHNYNSTTVGLAATLHVSAAIPNFLITEYFVNFEARGREIATPPFEVRNGHVAVPTRPGLGLDLDEAALARFPARPSTGRTMPTPGDEAP